MIANGESLDLRGWLIAENLRDQGHFRFINCVCLLFEPCFGTSVMTGLRVADRSISTPRKAAKH
jgi:hypothetical protein